MDPLSVLEAVTARIEQAKVTRAFGSSINAALTAVTQSKPMLEKLDRISGFVPLVGHALNADEKQNLKATIKDLRELGDTLTQASDATGVQESTRILSHDLSRDVANVQAVLNGGWKRMMEREFGVTGRLGRVLSQLPETKPLGNRMQALHQKAGVLGATLESAQKQQKEFNQLKEARDGLHEDLKKLGASDDVIAFLLAVANQTATVGKLSPKVRTWLAERQALELFKITL